MLIKITQSLTWARAAGNSNNNQKWGNKLSTAHRHRIRKWNCNHMRLQTHENASRVQRNWKAWLPKHATHSCLHTIICVVMGVTLFTGWDWFNTHNGDRPTHAIIMTDLWNFNTRTQHTHMGNMYTYNGTPHKKTNTQKHPMIPHIF